MGKVNFWCWGVSDLTAGSLRGKQSDTFYTKGTCIQVRTDIATPIGLSSEILKEELCSRPPPLSMTEQGFELRPPESQSIPPLYRL